MLKPFYELFLEKRVKEVTSQAVAAATGLSPENVSTITSIGLQRQHSNSSTVTKRTPNGKAKKS